MGDLLASVTQHHPHVINAGKFPAVNDLIGQEHYLHQAEKQQNAPTAPQPAPTRSPLRSDPKPYITPAWPKLTHPFTYLISPRLAPDPVGKPGHRQAPEAVCLTLSKLNGQSSSHTKIAEHRRVAEGSQSVSRETPSARPSHLGRAFAHFEAAKYRPLP